MVSSNKSNSFGTLKGDHLIDWLDSHAQFGNVLATAQLYLRLKQAVDEALPPALRSAFDVIKTERTTLTLTVSSAAFASKFRQLAPSVTRHLNARGWNFSEIQLKVQGGADFNVPPKPAREARALDSNDLQCFAALHAKLKPGPLADSVAKLLARHRPSDGASKDEVT
jgi:hypothetical protein